VLLSDEVAFVEDYLGVARERYEGDLRFAYHGAPELLSAAVPPLLLQPLVENSLKHGFSSERRALNLSLDAVSSDGWLTLTFIDDGCNGNHGVRGLGVGLDNLEQRIRRFGGPEATVKSGPGGNGGFGVVMKWKQNAQAMGAA
jgi:LytS/YehU family sensor histidine kinase